MNGREQSSASYIRSSVTAMTKRNGGPIITRPRKKPAKK